MGGNQSGKTTGIIWDLIHRCRGTHPFVRWKRPPINAVVISISQEQMGQKDGFHEKLWEMLPKDEIDPRFSLDPGRGITGKPPRVPFVRGPGAGSVISFATYDQGARRIAGTTADMIVLDEPPPEEMWEETMPRLFQRGGIARVGFTPTLAMADVSYLERLSQQVDEQNRPLLNLHMNELNEANIWPIWPYRRLTPLKTQAQIDRFELMLPAMTRDMRMGRSWRPLIAGRWLSAFGDHCIREELPPNGAVLIVSTDHGANAGKQVSMLIAVVGLHSAHPRVWWLDECGSDGATSPDQDAQDILEMLRRNGVEYYQVDLWVGDRATGRDRWGAGKSNRDLQSALARELALSFAKTKPIETVEKWDGSVEYGVHMLNTLFARRDPTDGRSHGCVRPRCKRFIAGCRTWKGDRKDPVKDIVDAGRYGPQHHIDERMFEIVRAIY